MATSSSSGDGRPARVPFTPDPRAFDFSFAFNNEEFSDRTLILEISDDTPSFLLPPPSLKPLLEEPTTTSVTNPSPISSSANYATSVDAAVSRASAAEQPAESSAIQRASGDALAASDTMSVAATSEGASLPSDSMVTAAVAVAQSLSTLTLSSSSSSSSHLYAPAQQGSAAAAAGGRGGRGGGAGGSTLASLPVSSSGVSGGSGRGTASQVEPTRVVTPSASPSNAHPPSQPPSQSNPSPSPGANIPGCQTPSAPALSSSCPPSLVRQATSSAICSTSAGEQGGARTVPIHVISAILASQSEFFKSLFSPQWRRPITSSHTSNGVGGSSSAPTSPEPSNMVHAPVVLKLSADEERPFLELMQYMYTGRLTCDDPESILHVLLVANKFGVLSCVSVCAHQLREVPLSLHTCCILLRVCSGVVLSEAAMFLVAASAAFLVHRFGSLDAYWQGPEFLELPLEAVEAVLGSDDVCVQTEETVFLAALHWVRHHCSDDLSLRKELIARLSERVRFALMEAEALHDTVLGAPEADSEAVRAMVQEGLWFKCFSFERQQEQIQNTIKQHRRFVRRRQLSLYSEVLLQDCYMLQTGQAILLPGGAWVCGKLFSLKVMRITAPVGGSDFGLFLQASQRCPTQDKVLDDSVSVEFSFKVKEWPSGQYVQQKQTASHTFKGLFRERGYRSLLNPWNEIMKDNNKYFRNGVMYLRADLRVIQPGESLTPFE